jgi:uncharacterized membrane protein
MSDLSLVYEAIKTLGEMNAQRHDEVIARLDKINGTIRRHDVELAEMDSRQKVCQARCQDCIARLEPTVDHLVVDIARLDTDIQLAKRFGKVALAVVSALFTVGVAIMGLL